MAECLHQLLCLKTLLQGTTSNENSYELCSDKDTRLNDFWRANKLFTRKSRSNPNWNICNFLFSPCHILLTIIEHNNSCSPKNKTAENIQARTTDAQKRFPLLDICCSLHEWNRVIQKSRQCSLLMKTARASSSSRLAKL